MGNVFYLEIQSTEHLPQIQADKLPLRGLFMMAAGYLPLFGTEKHVCMAECEDMDSVDSLPMDLATAIAIPSIQGLSCAGL